MIHHYRQMVDDPLRIAAFGRAIARAVRPGAIVTEIGCGLGTYAVMACRAGAARVYAVEAGPIAEVAGEIVRANGVADRVRVLPGYSTDLEPPERADVVIFEDYVSGLLAPPLVRVVADLTARWLKPGGTLLPGRARQWVAPVEDRAGHAEIDRFAAAGERVAGVDVGPTRRRAFDTPEPRQLEARSVLAAPVLARTLDLARVEDGALRVEATAPASRAGVVHGLALWFDLALGDGWLGTGPLDPRSAWAQQVFWIEEPLPVEEGAAIALSLEGAPFGDALTWRWSVEAGGARAAGSSLAGLPLRREALALGNPAHVPAAGEALAIDRAILDGVDGKGSVGAIAAELRRRFPARFASDHEAVRRVAEVLGRYAR